MKPSHTDGMMNDPPAGTPLAQMLVRSLVALAFCQAFLARSPEWVPAPWRDMLVAPGTLLLRLLTEIRLGLFPDPTNAVAWQYGTHGLYLLLISVLVPWLAMALTGRGRPTDIGLRLPNRLGLRIWVVSCLVALPSLWWLARGDQLGRDYLGPAASMGMAFFAGYYAVNMFAEHVLIHGLILGLCRADRRWPAHVPTGQARPGLASQWLGWLGLAQQRGAQRNNHPILAWLGLPSGCVVPMLTSACAFALVHVGKDWRELVLSIPGGLALAFAAYRTNSVLTPLAIHLTTAAITFLLIPR